MAHYSARQFLSLPAVHDAATTTEEDLVGIIEAITVNPQLMVVDGFLIGPLSRNQSQLYIPRECITQITNRDVHVYLRPNKRPLESRRVIGLSAWTMSPRVLVGFVHDFYFTQETGLIDSFIIHQLIRTWTIPMTAVGKITTRALLINNDTTIKLKITPFPTDPVV